MTGPARAAAPSTRAAELDTRLELLAEAVSENASLAAELDRMVSQLEALVFDLVEVELDQVRGPQASGDRSQRMRRRRRQGR